MLYTAVLLGIITVGLLANSGRYVRSVQNDHPASAVRVPVNGADVHVIEAGEQGPVVLMIHGASANAREYTWTLAPQLEDTHRVLMADRPGHGYSERPKNAHELGVQAAQMAGALEALAPGERAIVVGHSFGGAVALRVALDFPDLVDGLVLLAPVSHDWGGGGEAWYNQYAGHPLIGPAFSQLVPIVGPPQVKAGISNVFSPQPAPEGYFEKSGVGLLFRPSQFRANALDVNALRAEMAAQQARYPDIQVPVVVYSGALDTVISPPLHVGKLKHQVEGLELVKLADEGHMPHHGEADAIAAKIRELTATPVR
ncbi:MAG: alpha/beta hydrolase [Henriciella sp.]|nr:alpha/beta hydrolase [Henriciella sp.]